MTRWRATGAAAVAWVLLAGCGGGDATSTPTTTEAAPAASSPASSSTTTTSTTTAPSSSTTSTTSPTAPGPRFPDTFGDDADELVRAWGAGDRARATELARADVVDGLFAFRSPGRPHWDRGAPCEGAAGTTYCTYTDTETGEELWVSFTSIEPDLGGPRAVSGVEAPAP